MKQFSIFTALVITLLSTTLHAVQSSGTADVEIVTPLILDERQALSFGTIVPSSTNTAIIYITEEYGTVARNAGQVIDPGQPAIFSTQGGANRSYVLTFTEDISLQGPSGAAPLEGKISVEDGNLQRTIDNDGNDNFYIAGELTIPAKTSAGIYSTTYELNIEYN